MGKHKNLVAAGVHNLKAGVREYERWRSLLLEEFGPSVTPHIIEVRKWSIAVRRKSLLKLNCWDFMGCGKERGDPHAGRICPAFLAWKLHGVHGGMNAGRVCWTVAGTLCGGAVQGSEEQKRRACRSCDFYQAVLKEEGRDFLRAHILE